MKEFTSALDEAARKERDEDPGYPFWLDRDDDRKAREVVAYRPSDEQIALLMAETGRGNDMATKVKGAIDFFVAVFDEEDAGYLRRRLLDRADDFGLPTVQDIIEWLLEEWSGRPTKRPRGSTASRPNTSPSSRRRTPASTS